MNRMEPNLSTVRARLDQLQKLRERIDAEQKELEIAQRVLTRLAVGTTSAPPALPVVGGDTVNPPAGRATEATPVTQKDLIVATLRARAEPWAESSRDLQAEIERTHGVHIKDNSLLPLLTMLKGEGVIRRDAQNRIALAERVGGSAAGITISRRRMFPEGVAGPATEGGVVGG
jgi:hypothetical protein